MGVKNGTAYDMKIAISYSTYHIQCDKVMSGWSIVQNKGSHVHYNFQKIIFSYGPFCLSKQCRLISFRSSLSA